MLSLAGPAFSRDLLQFEPGDTLQDLRAKIQHNGYKFTVGHNWVFDMSPEEKRAFFTRRPPLLSAEADEAEDMGPLKKFLGKKLPAQFDWRNHNGHAYIGPVRNQGACGACYAFGACAAAEGTYNRAMGLYDGNTADFSESFIIWCLGRIPWYYPHFFGCGGADYDYYELKALSTFGVCAEEDFPYSPSDPGGCTHWADPRTLFRSWRRIPCNDVDAIKTAVMTYGPVDTAIKASPAFQAYTGGIYEDAVTVCNAWPCYYATTNHCIALLGWNDNGDPEEDGYWILRNSWGTGWGEDGYMRIKYRAARVSCPATYLVPQVGCGDYNEDGFINQEDFDTKRDDTVQTFMAWMQNYWIPKTPWGDFNGDGRIDQKDLNQKLIYAVVEFLTWHEECWLPGIS